MSDPERRAEATVREASPTVDRDDIGQGRFSFLRKRSLGVWASRMLSLVGIALIILSLTGWWLSTRVLDDEGFGDVVAKTAQQGAVRDYIGDQATLRLARS